MFFTVEFLNCIPCSSPLTFPLLLLFYFPFSIYFFMSPWALLFPPQNLLHQPSWLLLIRLLFSKPKQIPRRCMIANCGPTITGALKVQQILHLYYVPFYSSPLYTGLFYLCSVLPCRHWEAVFRDYLHTKSRPKVCKLSNFYQLVEQAYWIVISDWFTGGEIPVHLLLVQKLKDWDELYYQ